jgi:hypothetical protein
MTQTTPTFVNGHILSKWIEETTESLPPGIDFGRLTTAYYEKFATKLVAANPQVQEAQFLHHAEACTDEGFEVTAFHLTRRGFKGDLRRATMFADPIAGLVTLDEMRTIFPAACGFTVVEGTDRRSRWQTFRIELHKAVA